jgi:DNA-binding MarR family transcriptional regulator
MAQKDIDSVRAFNRFYTRIIGLLDNHILNSNYSLPEVRIMYELYHGKSLTASEIIDLLHLDKGYLSRILKQFERKKLVSKIWSKNDGRSALISLTPSGTKEFEKLNTTSNEQIAHILSLLTKEETVNLISRMQEIKTILEKAKL